MRAAGLHLALSAAVAAVVALLVFALWYPWPYREISGGRDLFLLVVAVGIVGGPVLTFAVFDLAKGWPVLRRDLVVITVLQLAGLAYGLWTVEMARPVHMVFEYDRFRVVHRVEIPATQQSRAPAGMELAPLAGPTLIALRPFRNGQEHADYTLAALQGLQLSARPELWQSYDAGRGQVRQAARPVTELLRRFPRHASTVEAALRAAGRDPVQAAYLPLVARKAEAWTVLLDANTADVIGFLPLDPF